MSLPTARDLIDYLRIEAEESSAEARLLSALITRATAMLEAWLDRPIETVYGAEYVDEDGGTDRLLVPVCPVDGTTLVLEDGDGTAVVATTYRVKALTGEIVGLTGTLFTNPPYTITCDVGLALHPQYGDRIEPVLSAAILDLAADLYHARNPRAAGESAGGGASTSYVNAVLPERVQAALRPYRLLRAV